MLRKPLSTSSTLPWEQSHSIKSAEPGLIGMSIVIPIYNSGNFLEKTLRSLMCNDLTGIEIILMDGGSTDNTVDIIKYYSDIFSISVSEKDGGQSDAINKGFSFATKPILYWLNGDDVVLPNSLIAVRKLFHDNSSAQVVVGNAFMTEVDFTPIRHFVFSPDKLHFGYLLDYAAHHLIQPSVFFTRRAWEEAGPVKEDLHYAMDADLFLTMAERFEFTYLPVDIAYSVYHEACKTRGKRGESITELALVQARHGGYDEARKTLDIIVQMYNESSSGDNVAPSNNMVGSDEASFLVRRVRALEAEMEARCNAILDEDVRALSNA